MDTASRRRLYGKKILIGDIPIFIFLGIVFFFNFYPFFYVLGQSVMPYENSLRNINWGFNGFTLFYFQQILQDPSLIRAFGMSLLRTFVGTSLNVCTTMACAYALSRNKMKIQGFLTVLFLIPMFFSAGLIPYFLTITFYGLRNTFWVLVLPGLISPMWLFVTKAHLTSYPQEILDAAHIDGAGQFKVFWKIVWPTSLPIISTLIMMYGIGHWNEFFWTRLLVERNLWTAPVHLFGMMHARVTLQGLGLGIRMQPTSFISAIAAVMIIPVFVVYPFIQRYIVSGMTMGAVKG
jgi:putative aldouronate transport system permease protein